MELELIGGRKAITHFSRRVVAAKQVVIAVLFWFLTAWRASALIGTDYQMELGNPGNATVDPSNHTHYLLQRTVDTVDYDDQLGEPNWVSWDLTAADFGNSGRNSSFFTDSNLPPTFYHVTPDDYTDSGYDRGHMCPSSDRTDNTNDNKLVFFMSNIVPQTVDNNGSVWSGLENYCQSLASAGDELLITCGPSGFNGTRIQPSGTVSIPGYTWKIAVVVPAGDGLAVNRITTATRVIAARIPNISGISGIPWQTYITSVNQIQADTGLTFFTALPPAVATVLRQLVDGTPAPVIASFTPTLGTSNVTVVITGTNLNAASAVNFNGVPAAAFLVDSNTQITASVPVGATTGPIAIVTPGGVVTSSSNFLITNFTSVVILTEPAGSEVNANSNAQITVQAVGSAPLTYQWWKGTMLLTNEGQVTGSTNATLNIFPMSAADAGSYSVVVSNYLGSVTSSPAALTLNMHPPAIVAPPAARLVPAGDPATFQVTATGAAPLAYFWRLNGATITGATQSTLTLPDVQLSDAGSYSVLITNNYGAITSAPVGLTIQLPASSSLVAQWNFNAGTTAPNTGTGTAALVGGATATFVSGSPNDTNTVNSAWNTTSYPAQGTANKTRGVQFNVSTRGYQDLVISWDQRVSNTGGKYFRLQYSTNGMTFMDGPVVTMTAANAFQSQTNFLAGLPGVDDNTNFAFRMVAEFESTAILTTNANYDSTTATNYGTSGTVRYDLVTVQGSPLVITSTLNAFSTDSGAFQLSVSGTADRQFALQTSTNLISWMSLITNSAPFDFIDTNLGVGPSRFYRTVSLP